MSRKISMHLIAGTALGFGGVASAQSQATLDASSSLDLAEAYRAELAADAAGRTSLQQNSRAGFSISSADGSSTLNIGGLVQFRYTANFRDDDAFDEFDAPIDADGDDRFEVNGVTEIDDDDFQHGFNVQRTRLDFYGNLAIPNFTYRVSAEAGDAIAGGEGDDLNVTWAYGQYDFTGALEGFYARLGIFKLPLYYEELVAPEYQLVAERSVVNEAFSQQYSEGIQIGYDGDFLRAAVAVSDGLATAGTQFDQPGEADIAVTGRFDLKLAGDWQQFEDFTSFRGSEFGARIGAAAHWETYGETGPVAFSNGSTQPFAQIDDPVGDIVRYTVDGQLEGNGWNVFAAFLGSYEEQDGPFVGNDDDDDNVNDFGVVVQGGFFLTDQVELFGRYDGLFLDEDRFDSVEEGTASFEEDLHFFTVGANYYFIPESHALKFTLDVGISFNETTALLDVDDAGNPFGISNAGGNTVTGFLGQDEDTEVVVRGQFQLLF